MTLLNGGMWRASARALGSFVLLGSFSALMLGGCPQSGVGDPCVPEDEYKEAFQGFKLSEENIESRSFQCQTRICLVNHFQGRVSCPEGQGAPTVCTNDETICQGDEACVQAGALITDCDPTPCGEEGANQANCNNGDGTNPACQGQVCDQTGKFCHCQSGQCPAGYVCDADAAQCVTKVCSAPGADNRCYLPGTADKPVATKVCSQCSNRTANDAVYCSCRCDVADGEPEDPNFNFCECPSGFSCKEIRPNLGLGDAQITGKYCVKDGTEFIDESQTPCGTVKGYWDSDCSGNAPVGGS